MRPATARTCVNYYLMSVKHWPYAAGRSTDLGFLSMARFKFETDKYYAAELRKVTQRPIENYPTRDKIHLIRLEFEIFRIIDEEMWLLALGFMASRDIVIGTLVDLKKDSGIAQYCEVLGLKEYHRLSDWKALGNRASGSKSGLALSRGDGS